MAQEPVCPSSGETVPEGLAACPNCRKGRPNILLGLGAGALGCVGGTILGGVVTYAGIVAFMRAQGEDPRFMDQLGILPILVAPVGGLVGLVAGVAFGMRRR